MTNKSNKEKLRVYEYAKSLNMSSKEIITILKRLGIPVNNHMSVMETEAVSAVEKFFHDIKSNAAAKRANEEAGKSGHANASSSVPSKPAAAQAPDRNHRPAAQATTSASTASTASTAGTKPTKPQSAQENRGQSGGGQGQRQNDRRGSSGQRRQDGRSGGSANQTAGNENVRSNNHAQGDRNRNVAQSQGQAGNKPQQRGNQAGQAQTREAQGARRNFERPNPIEHADADVAVNKPGKKTKSNQRRFDDNKPNSFKGNQGSKGNQKHGRGQRGGADSSVRKEKIDNTPKKIIVRGEMTVGETAKLLHKDASEVIKKLLFLGTMATINQELDLDTIQLIAAEYGVEVELKIPVEEDKFELFEENDDEADLIERPPVVTIMGHVDHGKTTLLDAIRHTSVSAGEAGGITQHIGAYQVEVNNKKITFLDTPGHEAFTTMRARGAQVTDITIIVVAADDGVMPQTVEAISHAKAAKVPIIVAVNKIDKPTADVDRIKQSLTEYELVPEEWGGDTIFCEVSAKQRIGLENLLEMILLVAEVEEYKANPNKRARGTIIEAELDKGRGPVARLLIQHGTLKVGDSFVAGVCFGRVRAMVNDKGKRLKEAGPSTPVEITGLTEVPQAGDPFIVFEDERKARDIAEKRAITLRQSEMRANSKVTLEELYKHIQEGDIKELNVIIKADVHGSVEALRGSLEKIDVEGARVKIIHTGVGAITESDIILASASNAIVIGFNVRPEPLAKNTAEQEKVDVRLYRIIYQAIEEIEQAMKGILEPVFKENIIGHAEVRNVFKITGAGTIAGCMVTSGKIARNAEVRLIRDGIVVLEGKIDSLKRFKDDVREVAQGYECGISLEKFNDIKEGDQIEAFIMETVER